MARAASSPELCGDRKRVERVLYPLGLVAKGNIWYIVASVNEEVRSYRISRVQHVAIADTPCIRPMDFNLERPIYLATESACELLQR